MRDLHNHVVPHIGHLPLSRVDGPTLNKLWATLAESGRAVRRPNGEPAGLSPKSVQNVAMTLHRVLKDPVRWGKITRNPADMADPPKRSASHHEVPSSAVSVARAIGWHCGHSRGPGFSRCRSARWLDAGSARVARAEHR